MNELLQRPAAHGGAAWRLLGRAAPAWDPPFLRLFCLPYAGGGLGVFHAWPARLPPRVELRAAELPGRDARLGTPPYRELRQAVRDLAQAAIPLLDRPFALFGHSMGALFAFELARLLRRGGVAPPCVLLLSGRPAPHLPERHAPLHALPDGQLLAALKRLNGRRLDALGSPELLRLCLPALRADFALCETYRHRPEAPLGCPTLVLGGLADPLVSLAELCAWKEQIDGPFALQLFPGDHFFLHGAESRVLAVLNQTLLSTAWAAWA